MDSALINACKHIEDFTGSCPLDTLDCDIDCDNRCSSDIEYWTCWYKYFKEVEE